MIVMIYRVRCEGACERFLNDEVGGQASMTTRASNALVFYSPAEARKAQERLFQDGRCPRCVSRG